MVQIKKHSSKNAVRTIAAERYAIKVRYIDMLYKVNCIVSLFMM